MGLELLRPGLRWTKSLNLNYSLDLRMELFHGGLRSMLEATGALVAERAQPQASSMEQKDLCELKEKVDQQQEKIGEILQQLQHVAAVVEEIQAGVKIIHETVAFSAIHEMKRQEAAAKRSTREQKQETIPRRTAQSSSLSSLKLYSNE